MHQQHLPDNPPDNPGMPRARAALTALVGQVTLRCVESRWPSLRVTTASSYYHAGVTPATHSTLGNAHCAITILGFHA